MDRPKQWYVSNGNGKVLVLTRMRSVAEAFAKGYRGRAKQWRPKQPR